ncbi:MAG TPA: CHAP domain-containing protein [Gaiellaceae bacterium]|nr:CHAP domain-containing protein [Gaiellaceae bacterium]
MLRRAAVTLALLAALSTSASASRTPLVYGYPYAARCPGAGIGEVVDRWGMYACNCTSYVAWALSANHQRIDWFIRGSMDAWNWPHVALLAGLTVDRTPTVGSVAVWPDIARPFGHVAYVTGVHTGNTIDVAEYNLPATDGADTFGFGTRSFVRPGAAVFIHVPQRAVSRR